MGSTGFAASTSSRRSLEVSLAALIAVGVILVFWSQQRYPALLKKLHAGTAIKVAGPISFDALLKVTPAMPAPTRVMRTSVNWLYTNRFGMYFAVPFGAAMMTLLAGVGTPRRFSSAAGNVLCGAVAGAPMGVCANCATPVAQSLLVGGASTRLTVAAMISSPSFNPVVVAMTFVLFPLPLAAMRVVAPALLLAALPWLVRENELVVRSFGVSTGEGLGARLLAFCRTYVRNLLRLTVLTLPWMLLAAVVGAMAAEMIPAYGTRMPVSVIGVVLVALLGTLLPVPMALDVALAYVLYHAGVPTPYVAVLLCTLGPVSVYSLSALGKQLDWRTSLRLGGAVALLGCVVGFVVMRFPIL
ncbi:hypothetical protein [Tunturiibacter gelidoferens]|jgi:uncharacterized membrane protein YraQ (UPF0718 family)|uniref:Permease n=1 Tax=Tunturiibacter gelidiferens TaxID=3069689 RepID=A0A9X0QIX8_9BACT|nr:hypothetical protein [Edaphobacter lichenicola]MBB5331078.1 hypothetical protein [Edaphobacter lichenicola]